MSNLNRRKPDEQWGRRILNEPHVGHKRWQCRGRLGEKLHYIENRTGDPENCRRVKKKKPVRAEMENNSDDKKQTNKNKTTRQLPQQ